MPDTTGLSAKVSSQVSELASRGWFRFAARELSQSRNPASKGWKQVLCEQLLSGTATRKSFELALVERLGISPKSAKVQASVGLSVFAAGRIASEQFGVLTLTPNMR